MSILTRNEIMNEIQNGNIVIDPFDPENVGPASVDLTLSNKFRIYKQFLEIHDVDDNADYKKITEFVETESIIIKPQQTLLGITREKVILADNICGWLEGRSRFARLGLLVHISASFMQPGISNHQVLEISNVGNVLLRLHAGTKICQFIFQRTIGSAKYKGRFIDQREP